MNDTQPKCSKICPSLKAEAELIFVENFLLKQQMPNIAFERYAPQAGFARLLHVQ